MHKRATTAATRRQFMAKAAGGVAGGLFAIRSGMAVPPAGAKAGMNYRRLGRTELMVSEIGFGGHHKSKTIDERVACAKQAFDCGINFFDAFEACYGHREIDEMGEIIRILGRPKDTYVAVHLWWHRKYFAMKQIEHYLKVLDTECIDVGWLTASHGCTLNDKTVETALKAKKQGKVRFIGVNGHEAIPVIRSIKYDCFDCLLYPYSFGFERAKEKIIPLARERDMGMVAIKPFNAGGVLRNAAGLKRLARQMGIEGLTPPQINLRFILSQPAVSTTVPGMAKPQWVAENARASIGKQKIARRELDFLRQAAARFPNEPRGHYAFLNHWRTPATMEA